MSETLWSLSKTNSAGDSLGDDSEPLVNIAHERWIVAGARADQWGVYVPTRASPSVDPYLGCRSCRVSDLVYGSHSPHLLFTSQLETNTTSIDNSSIVSCIWVSETAVMPSELLKSYRQMYQAGCRSID